MFGFNRHNQNNGFASAHTEAHSACRPADNKAVFIIIMDAIILASISVIIALLGRIAFILPLQALVLPVLVLLACLVLIAAIINVAGLKRTQHMY